MERIQHSLGMERDRKDVLDIIMKRRSIRKFTGEPVHEEDLVTLLKAGMSAPSSNNRRPWRYLVVTDPQKIRKISQAHPYARFAAKAGAIIIPFGVPDRRHYFFQDFGASVENILIAAAGIGLGATWCGMNRERQMLLRSITGLPERYWLFAVIPVGYPREGKPPRTQYDEAKVYWNRYGK